MTVVPGRFLVTVDGANDGLAESLSAPVSCPADRMCKHCVLYYSKINQCNDTTHSGRSNSLTAGEPVVNVEVREKGITLYGLQRLKSLLERHVHLLPR